MNFKAFNRLKLATVLTISFLVLSFAGVSIYFWNQGFINSDNILASYESSVLMQDLENGKNVKAVEQFVKNDQVREALKEIDRLRLSVNSINRNLDIEDGEVFVNQLDATKGELKKLIALPRLTSILLVLQNKISSFETFVVQNRWRTLTRMSRRLKLKVSPKHLRTPGFFAVKKLASSYRGIVKDISVMESITKSSILSSENKNTIITKLNTLRTELNMYEKYVEGMVSVKKSFALLTPQYENWFKKVAPVASLNKIHLETGTKLLVYSALGFFLFGVISIVMIFGFFTRAKKKVRLESDKRVISIIRDGLLKEDHNSEINLHPKFKGEFLRMKEYAHKRMSFGSIFRDATPFSSLLLDSNLNMVWANSLFYDSWGLEDQAENVTWDFLQRSTNLGENDPVLMALKDEVAGIYQIQVQTGRMQEALPYEMYVSPVSYGNQKRIMIFLYPLRSLEETLSNQTSSIVGPVMRVLTALGEDKYTEEFRSEIKKDFDIAGISQVYSKFDEFNEAQRQRQEELMKHVTTAEDFLDDKMQLLMDVESLLDNSAVVTDDTRKKFEDVKDAVIKTVDLRYEIEDELRVLMEKTDELLGDQNELFEKSVTSSEIISENVKTIDSILGLREKIKGFRSNADMVKNKICQSVDQLLVFQKGSNDNRMSLALSKVKSDVKNLEKLLGDSATLTKNLDMILTKSEMVLEKVEIPNFSQMIEKFSKVKGEIELVKTETSRLSRDGQFDDEKVVLSLKKLHESFSEIRKNTNYIGQVVKTGNEVDSKAIGTPSWEA